MLYTYNATIIEVYDGDTYTAKIDLGFKISNIIKIRAKGINTPELRGATKLEGQKVRDIVRSKILNKQVIITTYKDKTEKYGRYLGIVMIDGVNLNQWLVDNGYASKYMTSCRCVKCIIDQKCHYVACST